MTAETSIVKANEPSQGPAAKPRYFRLTSNALTTLGIASDAFSLLLAALLTRPVYDLFSDQFADPKVHASAALLLAFNFFLVRLSRDAYAQAASQAEDVGSGAILDFLLAVTLTAITAAQFDVFDDFSRGMLLIFVGLSVSFFFLGRIATRRMAFLLMDAGVIGQRVAIYGADGGNVRRVLDLLAIERLPHLRIVGFADNRKTRIDVERIDEVAFIGGFAELLTEARAGQLDQVIIALPRISQARLDAIAEELSSAAIDVCVLPREVIEFPTRYRLNYIGELPVFKVWQQPVRDFDGVLKAVQDRVLAAIAIVVLSPLLALVALAIKLESSGPIFFRQRRFGFNNAVINVIKFRSMHIDKGDLSGAERTVRDDPRVTRVGKFIRRFSIDELPQLFNVLQGEMSLVGPRPHATAMRVGERYYFDAVDAYRARHRVKPGITGLAQVRGFRGEIATVEQAKRRVEYDIYYIEHWSPLLDARIIVETVFQLIWKRDVY
jgi:polysaccharide biosynthesis protein PslA